MQRSNPQRLVNRDLLVWPPLLAAVVAPRDHRLNRHQRFERTRPVVRCTGHTNPRVEERPVRKHPAHLVGAVLVPLLTVEIHVRPEWRGYRSRLDDARNEVGIHERAMFNPMTPVGRWPASQGTLIRLEHHVDRDITVRVNAHLPAVAVRVVHGVVNLLLRHCEDAVVGRPDVRRAHAHGALRCRPVRRELHAANPHPLIAESGVQSGVAHLRKRGTADHHVRAMPELAGGANLLVGGHVVGRRPQIVHRREARGREQFGDVRHALPGALAPLLGRERLALAHTAKHVARELRHTARQFAARITEESAVRRVRGRAGDAGQFERLAVVPARVTAAVIHGDRMFCRHGIERLARERHVEFGVIEHRTGEPETGGC